MTVGFPFRYLHREREVEATFGGLSTLDQGSEVSSVCNPTGEDNDGDMEWWQPPFPVSESPSIVEGGWSLSYCPP